MNLFATTQVWLLTELLSVMDTQTEFPDLCVNMELERELEFRYHATFCGQRTREWIMGAE